MSAETLDLQSDFQWLPPKTAIRCPDCGGEAHFQAADLLVPLKSEEASFRKQGLRRIQFSKVERHYSSWFRDHYLLYDGFGTKFPKGVHPFPGGQRRATNCLWGTSFCTGCFNHHKVKLKWPEEAYFQLSYGGRCLWFYNRGHVVAMLELLAGADRSRHPWGDWFSRKLPTVFKTARARRQLPPKLRKMLRT